MEMKEYSAKAFQRKIDAFCQLRLTSHMGTDDLSRLTAYMHTLIQSRQPAPRISGKTDWDVVAVVCGIGAELLATNERQIDPAFDARSSLDSSHTHL